MESFLAANAVNFDTLQGRLIALANFRIRNGEFTERGLARMLQVSQPQMHNVLKGQRRLRWELADALLARLNISVLDLLNYCDTVPLAFRKPPQSESNMRAHRRAAAV
ncbi:MAG: helix-turn-helix transcriptional regulator [Bryobacteraceae bacterium]